MLISDLVVNVFKQLENIRACEPAHEVLVRMESQMAYDKLYALLMTHEADDAPVSMASLKPFVRLLNARGEIIVGTDAIYFHRRFTLANLAYVVLANELALYLRVDVLYLLMPSCDHTSFHVKGDTIEARLRQHVVADDGSFISVPKCLHQAFHHQTKQLYHPVGQNRLLTRAERCRVMNHSFAAMRYYIEIQEMAQGLYQGSREQAFQNFEQAIKQENYRVTTTYGESGQKKLADYILSQCYTVQKLIEVIVKFIPATQWRAFAMFMPSTELSSLLLGSGTFAQVLQDDRCDSGGEQHQRVRLLLLAELLSRYKHAPPNTYLAWFIEYSYYKLGGSTYAQQLGGIRLLQQFLMSDLPMGELKTFLNDIALHKIRCEPAAGVIFNDETLPGYIAAILEIGSQLRLIAHQMKVLSERGEGVMHEVVRPG